MPIYLLALIYWLHLVASVVWIGGLALIVLILPPVLVRVLDDEQHASVLAELTRRFRPLANFSLALLVVTGILQMTSDVNYDGFLHLSNLWARAILFKHVAIGGMVVVAIYVQLSLHPALERARLLASRNLKSDKLPALRIRQHRLSLLDLAFGLLVLFLTALATSQ